MQPVFRTQVIAPPRSAARRRRDVGRTLTIIGFLVPPALIYFLFVLLPIVQSAYYSLYRWNGLGPLQNFIGIENYQNILYDKIFVRALGHNLMIVVLSLAIQLPLALGLALLVGRNLPGRSIFRTIYFLPFVLSEVITGLMWSFIYRPQAGLFNSIIQMLIPSAPARAWLADPNSVMVAIFIVICWKFLGFHMILYVAGLQNIPAELEEAARIDGAANWQVLQHVTLPLLGSTIRLSIFLSVLGSLQFFDLVWVMTTGGPVNASDTMATYLYKFGFQRFQLGYGSAIAVVMFLMCFGFSLIYQRVVMRRDYE